jgi:hypothetical protein
MTVQLLANTVNIPKRVIRVRKDIATNWWLHHDNAPSHTSLLVREFLAKHHVATLPQPRGSRLHSKDAVLKAFQLSKRP